MTVQDRSDVKPGLPPDPLAGLSWQRIIDIVAARPCCDLHRPAGCCDTDDCGPCCERCPTCPSTRHPVLLTGHEARMAAGIVRTQLRKRAKDLATRRWRGAEPDHRPVLVRRYTAIHAALLVVVHRVGLPYDQSGT